ncbi:recombinase family protein [Streptomyces sp. NPDC020917]|uniref:recombinase family protein n=1 Tax=Streptomyces sp. NPDC020917 TaxID=3365102 RepID=UPI0037B1F21E
MGSPEVDLLVRKSKVVREGEHALSLRAQEDRGRRWADENGYTVRKVWRENLSAYSDIERPKYDAAMKAVLDGEVPALWCFALDRFTRKGIEAIGPILGRARVVFDYEGLDSANERDRRWIIQRAEDAREFSQRLSHNINVTKSRQRSEGRWLGRPPFGLTADPKTRKLAPDTVRVKGKDYSPWDVVCRIFAAVAGGLAARALARQLNSEGKKSATGKDWRADAIRLIIIHPVYEGYMTASPVGRVAVRVTDDRGNFVRCVEDDVLPQMIPAELAERARRVLSGHQIIENAPRPGRATHWLTGRLRCVSCKRTMTVVGKSYTCQTHTHGGVCDSPAIASREALERYLSHRWLAKVGNADPEDPLMAVVAERWTALTRPAETAEVAEARAALKAAEKALEAFHADDRAGFYTGRSAKYRLPAKEQAETRLTAAEERLSALSPQTIDITFLLEDRAPDFWENSDDALKRDLFGLAVDVVYVTKAPHRGAKFDGFARCDINWADVEGEE